MNGVSNDEEIRQQITKIAISFQIFEFVACAQAIKDFLIARGIPGKQIKLSTGSINKNNTDFSGTKP